MVRAGAGLVAAVATTDAPPSTGVVPAARVSRGGAVALHPMCWPSPRLGPSSTMTPLVGKVPGSSPRAVDPNAKVLPSALGQDLSRHYYFKWTPKVNNLY